mmetsp:Transcript_28817/g.62236  ORF Transcript_28817/g.62236 Transcript_28817/m.62236 type:complete len:287 (-) Transcript_28817:64-924(-)
MATLHPVAPAGLTPLGSRSVRRPQPVPLVPPCLVLLVHQMIPSPAGRQLPADPIGPVCHAVQNAQEVQDGPRGLAHQQTLVYPADPLLRAGQTQIFPAFRCTQRDQVCRRHPCRLGLRDVLVCPVVRIVPSFQEPQHRRSLPAARRHLESHAFRSALDFLACPSVQQGPDFQVFHWHPLDRVGRLGDGARTCGLWPVLSSTEAARPCSSGAHGALSRPDAWLHELYAGDAVKAAASWNSRDVRVVWTRGAHDGLCAAPKPGLGERMPRRHRSKKSVVNDLPSRRQS